MAVLVSPTEPSELVKMLEDNGISAFTSSIPEINGADYLIPTPYGFWGIQRKEVPFDFLQSVWDGRLAKETSQLKKCTIRTLLGEGKFRYYQDGTVHTLAPPAQEKLYHKFNRSGIRKLIMEIKIIKGVDVDFVEDMADTCRFIVDALIFIQKDKHTGMFSRPGIQGAWGSPTTDEYWSHILQGFAGIGPTLADNILKSFGKIPLTWDCDFEDLARVPGIGQRRAEKLWRDLLMRT